jgi:predicted nucleic acid-binding protein
LTEILVVDASVAAKWVLDEPGRDAAVQLIVRQNQMQVELIAPDLILLELSNMISKRERRKLLTTVQAEHAFHFMVQSSPRLARSQPLIPSALELSRQHQLSFWDSVYLALALERGCSLITADHRLYAAAVTKHPFVQLLDPPDSGLRH